METRIQKYARTRKCCFKSVLNYILFSLCYSCRVLWTVRKYLQREIDKRIQWKYVHFFLYYMYAEIYGDMHVYMVNFHKIIMFNLSLLEHVYFSDKNNKKNFKCWYFIQYCTFLQTEGEIRIT